MWHSGYERLEGLRGRKYEARFVLEYENTVRRDKFYCSIAQWVTMVNKNVQYISK